MQKTRRAPLRRVLASVLTGALLASGAALGVAVPAQAAEAPVTASTLNWGIKDSFRNYVVNLVTTDGSIAVTPNAAQPGGGASPFVWSGGAGTYDSATGAADVSYSGAVHFVKHGGELDITFSNPRIDLDGSTGTLYLDVTSAAFGGAPAVDQYDGPFATLSAGAPSVTGKVATWSGVGATLTSQGAQAFAGFYTAGTALDALSFAAPFTVPAVATTTALSASPAGTATAGSSVALTATVSPAAAGSVEFFDGTTSLGSAAVASGVASVSTTSLTVGTHSLTAVFTPADASAFVGSTSAASTYAITAVPAPDADSTKTTVAVAPAPRAALGSTVTLTGTVANTEATDVPVGSVEFFRVAAGSTQRVSVGEASLVGGVATLTSSTVPAGGHGFVAVYEPGTSDFEASESAASANYGVVDTSAPAACTPVASAATSETAATASWNFSGYSLNSFPAPWAKTAEGSDITVSGTTFEFANGEVVADAACATVSFDGSFRIEPHSGVWVTFTDPVLSVDAKGTGVWTADITASDSPAAERIVFASFTDAAGFGPGASVDASIAFDYTNATAFGTWSAAYGNAWPNAFILKVPSSIQAYFYQTGTSSLNLQKGPDALALEFEWPAATTTTLAVSPATPARLGSDVTLKATVVPAVAEGVVEFFQTSVVDGKKTSLGTAVVSGGTASVTTAALAAGGHSLTAEFVSTNGYDASEGAYVSSRGGVESLAYYGIVDPAVDVVAGPTSGEHVSNVTAEWDWSQYAAEWTKAVSGNVTVEDDAFVLSNGTGIVTEDAARIDFSGTLRVETYAAILGGNGAWIELVDPTLTIADGVGTWTAAVRSGVGVYSASATQELVVATISGAEVPDFSADSVDDEITFDYAGTTAAGTWSTRAGAGYADAWTNQFVLAVPSSIQAFYYASGATGDARKAPADLQLSWTEPTPSVTILNGGGNVVQGGSLEVAGTGFRDGTVVTAVVNSEPVTIGTATADASGAVAFTWAVPATFETGAHSLTLSVGGVVVASAPLTVSAAAVLPVTEAPEAPSCIAQSVSGASIQWGVKESFRTYIAGPIAKGSISGGWGAGAGAYSTDTDRGRVSYTGAIHYTGHNGLLDMTLSNPRIQVNSATSASLILNVQSTDASGDPAVNASGVVFASLSLPAAAETSSRISWSNASATLTAAGAEAFAGFYSAGTALDPVSFSFPLGAEVPCDSTTTGDLAATGGETSFDVMWLGAGLLALGALLVVARRRRLTV